MIALDKIKLENQLLVEEAQLLYKARFISKDQFSEIITSHPALKKQQNLLLRIGFALLGILLYSSICGFISFVGFSFMEDDFEIFLFLFAAVGSIGAEFFANQNYSEQGLDDSFIIGSQLVLFGAIASITNENELIVASVATIVSLLTYLRYLNRASIIIFCVASTSVIAFGLFELGIIAKSILPFIVMIYGIGIYFACKRIAINLQFPFYQKGILLVKYYGLILFYFSGNYLVVRELSIELMGSEIAQNSDISFAWFFYTFTFIVPGIYMFFGIKLFDRALLYIGFLCFVFTLYTIDLYFLEVSAEIYLIVAGLLLFTVAYFSIKKLKDKREGLTFQPDRFTNSTDFINTEALILTSQFGLKPENTIDSPMKFGDGGFSGGGSNGGY